MAGVLTTIGAAVTDDPGGFVAQLRGSGIVNPPPGWHPDTDEDVAILRAELDACRVEIARLRREVARLEGEK